MTGARALMDVRCAFVGEVTAAGDDFLLSVTVPVRRAYLRVQQDDGEAGAHNQRTAVTLEVRTVARAYSPEACLWIEELVEIADGASSCPVYPLLKRADSGT